MRIERKDEIIHMVTEDKVVKANLLSEKFQVSMETIRRDLEELEKEGIVKRVHGGAVINLAHSVEPDYSYREIKNYEEKLLIGKKAVSLVEDGETIIIDIGTTTLEFARFLRGKKKVTVLTNSLKIAFELMDDPNITVIIFGGKVRLGEGSTSGYWAEEMVDQFYADKLFLGVGTLETEKGIMDYHIEESNLRRHFIHHAKQIIGLADYSKFEADALNMVCETPKIDYIVTDEKTSKKVIKRLNEKGVQVILA
ncbi:MAG: DeoR/GlpR family DNA-binding transcription regulator [Hespellia sp.]|nr:DeoR/GlpR family DNA-binding transcription regulator [Hespellia sp.]